MRYWGVAFDTDWQAGFVDHPRAKNLLGHNPASVMFALRQRGIGPGPKTTGNGKKVGRPSKMSLAARKRWAKHRAKLNGHDDESAGTKPGLTPKLLRLIDRKVGEKVAAILRDNCYCGRCGKNLEPQLIASSFSTTHQY